jgi:hypothetical protein
VCDKVKQAALDAAEIMFPVKFPNSVRGIFVETRDIFGIVHVPPWCNVVNASDEIIPCGFPG